MRNGGRMALSCLCILMFLYTFAPSMLAVHRLRVEKSDVRVLLLHFVQETGLWSC
jgi:hypothetical protein